MKKERIQKVFYITNKDIKNLIEKYISEKSELTKHSESRIIEEYILAGICRDFDGEDINIIKKELNSRYSFVKNDTFPKEDIIWREIIILKKKIFEKE